MKFPERFSNLPDYVFPRLRAYSCASQPAPVRLAEVQVCADHAYVAGNRALYRVKYAIDHKVPGQMPRNSETPALKLWQKTGVRALARACLAQDAAGVNPGAGYIRVAMVAQKDDRQRGLIGFATACITEDRL